MEKRHDEQRVVSILCACYCGFYRWGGVVCAGFRSACHGAVESRIPGLFAEQQGVCRDAEWGERVIAVVAPADRSDPPTLELLRLHVRQRLPRYAAPSRVVIVDDVPVLPSGKHDIARLKLELLPREQTEAENVTY